MDTYILQGRQNIYLATLLFRHQNTYSAQMTPWNKRLNVTPPKTNMEPENGPLEKEIPFGNHPFQVPAVSFRGCIAIFPTTHVISKSFKVSRLAIGCKQLFSFFLVRAEDCPSHRPWSFMLTPRPPAVALVVAWVNHGPAQLDIPLFQPNFNQVGHLILEICFLTKDTVTTNKSWMLFDLKREKVKKTLSRHLLTHSLKRRFGYSLTPRSKESTPRSLLFCSSSPQPPPGTFVEFPTVDIEELLRSRLIGAVIRITSAFSTERLLF